MVKNYFLADEEAIELIEDIIQYGKSQGVTVFIETHRATVTQDLKRAVFYAKSIDDLLLTIDLSHYIVSGEFTEENMILYEHRMHEYFDILLEKTASIHIRLSNGEQVQVPLNRIGKVHLNAYKNWWKKGLENASKYTDEPIPIIIELGPEDYQQKVIHKNQWIYDCDRWEEALALKRSVLDWMS